MPRLWHSITDATVPDDTPSKQRRWRVTEDQYRRMIAAEYGKPSAKCDVCCNLVKLEFVRWNEQRWNADQSCTCTACAKYGDPHNRPDPDEDTEYALVDGELHQVFDTAWFKTPVMNIGECQVCHDTDVALAYTFNLPAWLIKRGARHVCLMCSEAAKELEE